MNTPFTPWINLTLHQAQRCHHLAWFLYGWFEREQLLNLEAFVDWWVGEAASAPGRSRSCRRDGLAPSWRRARLGPVPTAPGRYVTRTSFPWRSACSTCIATKPW